MTELNLTEKSACGCGAAPASLPELDARVIPHAIRHAAIHGAVDSLQPGAALVLIAPHDPIPLLRQFEERHGGAILIEYLERGPEDWKLKLERARS